MIIFITVVLMAVFNISQAEDLQAVDQTEFLKLITEKRYVVALFCPSSAMERCKEFEGELSSIREDLIEVLDGDERLVKMMDSPMVQEYAVGKTDQPVIIMFRSGLPVIYDGPANDEEMLNTLVRYKEPGVQELTDSSFEHLTQAASGATTGDWLVMFFTSSCQLCNRLTAALETVACRHRGRSSVARINKETHGEKTGRRFELGLEDKPDIILFRQGRMYRYQVERYDHTSLTSFITGFYKNYPAQSIPLPKSPFDDLVDLSVDYLVAYPALVGTGLCLAVLLLLAFAFFMREGEEPRQEEEEEQEEEAEHTEKKESKKDT